MTNSIVTLTIQALEELKATQIAVLDVRQLTSITDDMVVCSGNSTRHVISIAQHVIEMAKQAKVTVLGCEGEEDGEWVLVDLGDVIVHVMLQQTREFYDLEALWSRSTHRATLP